VGRGLLLPLRMSLDISISDFDVLRKWAEEALSVSMGRPPFSKNFSVAICWRDRRDCGGKGRRRMGREER